MPSASVTSRVSIPDPKGFGERLNKLIGRYFSTQRELATLLGVTEGTLSRWTKGEQASITRVNLIALAKALHVSSDFLLTGQHSIARAETDRLESDVQTNVLRRLADLDEANRIEACYFTILRGLLYEYRDDLGDKSIAAEEFTKSELLLNSLTNDTSPVDLDLESSFASNGTTRPVRWSDSEFRNLLRHLEVISNSFGPNVVGAACAHRVIASVYQRRDARGDNARSDEHCRYALRILRNVGGDSPPTKVLLDECRARRERLEHCE